MLPMAAPNATIDEHLDLAPDKSQIQSPGDPLTNPVTQPGTPERTSKNHLRTGIRAPNARHFARTWSAAPRFHFRSHCIETPFPPQVTSVSEQQADAQHLYICITFR